MADQKTSEETVQCALEPRVDLAFALSGKTLPQDHGYTLFSALSRLLGNALHGADWLAVHRVRGLRIDDHTMTLDARYPQLRLRLLPAELPRVLGLAGKRVEVQGHSLRIGVPSAFALLPAPSLMAPAVVIKFKEQDIQAGPGKRFVSEELFRDAVARQLAALGAAARIEIGGKREVRISDKRVVGYCVRLFDLDDDSSLRVQYAGIGGRQRFGCGVFTPLSERGVRTVAESHDDS